jgi:signal transduction histidine kinase
MISNASITRRLTLSVLLLEFVAALVLIATVGNHERHVQFTLFKTNLRASATSLLGAVQEGNTKDGSIAMDQRSLSFPRSAVYRVSDAEGSILGTQGHPPSISAGSGSFTETDVDGQQYLFYSLTGEKTIDPGKPFAISYNVRAIYGMPVGRVWHEVIEAIRFFTLATLVLLGITALLLTWLTRRFLQPIRHLAAEADRIDTDTWVFNAPSSSRRFVELQPLASAIEESVARLQRSFEQQRRFTSDAAHELKTDLAIVKSSLQVLSMRQRTVDEYEVGIRLGLDDIGRLEGTVKKMLTLARLEQASRPDNQRCDFSEAVLDAVTQSEPFAELKQVKVVVQVPTHKSVVLMSKEDAFLLCSNVLVNALQHSPPQGKVEVIVTHEPARISLSIKDEGEGIALEDKPFLFDAFFRGDASRSRRTGSTGLGLSICKALCSRSGGTISLSNHPDGGAFLEIGLPTVPADIA